MDLQTDIYPGSPSFPSRPKPATWPVKRKRKRHQSAKCKQVAVAVAVAVA